MERKTIKKGVVEIELAHLLYEYSNLVCLSISNFYDSLLFLQLLIIPEVEHMLINVVFTFTIETMLQPLCFICRNRATCLWHRYLRIKEKLKDYVTRLDTCGCPQLC